MQMEKDWLQLQRFNLSVINALLRRPRCKRGRDGGTIVNQGNNLWKVIW